MKVFLDTSAWLALEIKNDIHHPKARQCAQDLKKRRALFLTNDYVLDEAYTRLLYDVHLPAARLFRQKIEAGVGQSLALLEVGPPDRQQAWKELKKYQDHKLSFTDAVIIAHFKKYRLDKVFTFDQHFQKCGLPTIPLQLS